MAEIETLTRLFEQAENEVRESLHSVVMAAYSEGHSRGRKAGFREGFEAAIAQLHNQFEALKLNATRSAVTQRVGRADEHDTAFALAGVQLPSADTQTAIVERMAAETPGRTRRGMVEKLVLTVLRDAPSEGLNGKQVAQRTRALGYLTVKDASVRGTLRKLLSHGKVEKVENLWRTKRYDL